MDSRALQHFLQRFRTQDFPTILGGQAEAAIAQAYLRLRFPFPPAMAERLEHLQRSYDALQHQAIQAAETAADKVTYWPTYRSITDFQQLAPEHYQQFLGVYCVYATALYQAELQLSRRSRQGQKEAAILRTHALAISTYLPWLHQRQQSNTLTQRQLYVQHAWQQVSAMGVDVPQMQAHSIGGALDTSYRLRTLGKILQRLDGVEVHKAVSPAQA